MIFHIAISTFHIIIEKMYLNLYLCSLSQIDIKASYYHGDCTSGSIHN